MSSEIGENFAIKFDAIFFQQAHEVTVGKTEWPDGSIDFHLPQCSRAALLLAAMAEGVRASVKQGSFRLAFLLASAEAVTLNLFKDAPAMFRGDCPSFNSWHI